MAALLTYYKVPTDRLVVVHDELDLPTGAVRVKFGGGDNGHNGLKSVRQSLGTGDFHRVRLGIGRPPGRQAPADFVLAPLTPQQRDPLMRSVDRAADAVESLILEGLDVTQSEFN